MKTNILNKYKFILLIISLLLVVVILYFWRDGEQLEAFDAEYDIPIGRLYIEGDEDGFYGDENGILVGGRQLREYKEGILEKIENHEPISIDISDIDEISDISDIKSTELLPANYNHKEWIRNCSIRLYDAKGKEIMNDRAGIRISGNASRKLVQKSFMIIADEDLYGSKNNRFYLGTDFYQLDRFNVNSYKKLRIHSNGQDLRETQLRDEIIFDIAQKCGLEPLRWQYPVLVYINNEYYGIAHIENPISEDFLASYYNLDKEKIEIIDSGIQGFAEALSYDYKNPDDFCIEDNRKAFEEKVDIDNFFSYYAFNMLINNYDWPVNNVLAWRYTGKPIEGIAESDGKYRFAVTDVDAGFMSAEDYSFSALSYGECSEYYKFMEALLRFPEYKEKFVNAVMDQLTLAYDEDFLTETVENTVYGYGDAFEYAKGMVTDPVMLGYLENHDMNLNKLVVNALARKGQVYDKLYQYYDTGEGYILRIIPPNQGCIRSGAICVNSDDEELDSLRSKGCSTYAEYESADKVSHSYFINGQSAGKADDIIKIDSSMAIDGIVTLSVE